jgi:hypothetical protein
MSTCSIKIGPADLTGWDTQALEGRAEGARLMEVAFTYGVRMKAEEAEAVGAVAHLASCWCMRRITSTLPRMM